MLSPEQHNVLSQLAQMGLQKLAEIAGGALDALQPEDPEPGAVEAQRKPRAKPSPRKARAK